jgi:hypothetical protein
MTPKKKPARPVKPLPMVWEFCTKLTRKIDGYLAAKDEGWSKLFALGEVRDDLSKTDKQNVIVALLRLRDRCQSGINFLSGKADTLEPAPLDPLDRGAREAPLLPPAREEGGDDD